MINKFSALLFDMDGTLIDSRADLAASVNHVLADLGFPVQTEPQITARIGNGLRRLLVDTLQLEDPKLLSRAKDLFEEHYSTHCLDKTRLYDGVKTTLDDLLGRFKMAVVTNKPFAYADKIVQELGLRRYFETVVGGDSAEETKPHPEPLYLALRQMDVKTTGNVLMVGDGIQDLLAAKAAQVQTCLVQYGFGFHTELLKQQPTFTIKEFIQLKEIVS